MDLHHYDRKNPVFDSPPDSGGDRWIPSSVLPTGLSRVPLTLRVATPGHPKRYSMALTAGFLGVSQSSRTLALRPELGWVVHEELGLDAMLRRLVDEHPVAPPLPEDQLSRWQAAWALSWLPADILHLYSTCDGASLFGEPGRPTYRIRSVEELEIRLDDCWWPAPTPSENRWHDTVENFDAVEANPWVEVDVTQSDQFAVSVTKPPGACIPENGVGHGSLVDVYT